MFSNPVPFEKAYPEVENISVNVKEAGYMLKRENTFTLTKNNIYPNFSCSNISCKQGGISIERLIRDMIRNKETEINTQLGCKGHEGSPKGRRRGRDCMNHFEIQISIEYKENSTNTQDS